MTAIDTIMFILPLAFGLLFFIFALMPRSKEDKRENPVYWQGILYSALAMILLFVEGEIWPAVATSEMFVMVAYVWFALGFISFVLVIANIFLVLKAELMLRKPSELTIRESEGEEE